MMLSRFFTALLTLGMTFSLWGEDEQYERYVEEFTYSFSEIIKEELHLELRRWGGAFHDYFKQGLEFYAFHRATLEEARALELAVLNRLNEATHPYPLEKPISVAINFVQPDHRNYADGSIDSVVIFNDWDHLPKRNLWYRSTNPYAKHFENADDDQIFETLIIEPLENAIQLNHHSSTTNLSTHTVTEFESTLDQIIASFKQEMKSKHHMEFKSLGWMVSGKSSSEIEEIRGSCDIFQRKSQGEARALMLNAAKTLLDKLNTCEALKPYLKEYPFPANKLKMRISFKKHQHFVGPTSYHDGSMVSVTLNENQLTYSHYSRDREQEDLQVLTENYEEALQLQKSSHSLSTMKKIARLFKTMCEKISYFLQGVIILFYFCIYSLFGL